HIDLNVEKYSGPGALESAFDANLRPIESRWGAAPRDTSPSTRFLGLIQRAAEKSGRKVVVLIDEYDKPLLETLDNPDLNEEIRRGLKAFYGILKTADPWLRFVLLTGVTKFSQVSVFSDLNQLRDISLDRDYAGICGITLSELTGTFEPELQRLAQENGMTYDEALAETQKRYNGYHFSRDSEGVLNPFSILNTFASGDFRYYWFQTGTPTFLVKLLQQADFDLRSFGGGISIPARHINDYRIQGGSPVPLLYQSGYLTITGYDRHLDEYTLGFPNEEVQYGFLNFLLPYYLPKLPQGNCFSVTDFIKDLQKGDVEGFMTRLRAFFSSIPYELNDRTERHYQAVFYVVFTLMGQYTGAEVRSAAGRADAVVSSGDTVYVFEFKLAGGGTVEDALRQIDEKGYLIPWTAGGKKLVKVGAVFDPAIRTLGEWKAV
ncbi:MAG: ATP-binding protein, partial [Treponema sp.]|nr:ATP-binding protein [Treponema sp.]